MIKKGISIVNRRVLILKKLESTGQLDLISLSNELGMSEVRITASNINPAPPIAILCSGWATVL